MSSLLYFLLLDSSRALSSYYFFDVLVCLLLGEGDVEIVCFVCVCVFALGENGKRSTTKSFFGTPPPSSSILLA